MGQKLKLTKIKVPLMFVYMQHDYCIIENLTTSYICDVTKIYSDKYNYGNTSGCQIYTYIVIGNGC